MAHIFTCAANSMVRSKLLLRFGEVSGKVALLKGTDVLFPKGIFWPGLNIRIQ